jgi:hypothetical protein
MASETVSSPINQADEKLMEDMPKLVQKGERLSLSPAQSRYGSSVLPAGVNNTGVHPQNGMLGTQQQPHVVNPRLDVAESADSRAADVESPGADLPKGPPSAAESAGQAVKEKDQDQEEGKLEGESHTEGIDDVLNDKSVHEIEMVCPFSRKSKKTCHVQYAQLRALYSSSLPFYSCALPAHVCRGSFRSRFLTCTHASAVGRRFARGLSLKSKE